MHGDSVATAPTCENILYHHHKNMTAHDKEFGAIQPHARVEAYYYVISLEALVKKVKMLYRHPLRKSALKHARKAVVRLARRCR